MPVSFLGLVIAYQFPGIFPDSEVYKSQKSLVEAYRQQAAPDERLIYLKENAYSAQFYLHGKVLELAGPEVLQSRLSNSTHDFYVLRAKIAEGLPETVKAQLEPVKSYGMYILFHAVAGKR